MDSTSGPRGRPFTPGVSGNSAGRPRGAVNKQTLAAMLARAGGMGPLEYLLKVVNDEKAPKAERIEAAKAALPYCHRRLPEAHPIYHQAIDNLDGGAPGADAN
jgi:hypothetical protein